MHVLGTDGRETPAAPPQEELSIGRAYDNSHKIEQKKSKEGKEGAPARLNAAGGVGAGAGSCHLYTSHPRWRHHGVGLHPPQCHSPASFLSVTSGVPNSRPSEAG